jgi:hypothetical protein
MRAELEQKLVEEFPGLFAGIHLDPSQSLMCFGCECGDGWYQLIYNACKELSALGEDIRFVQIKEKYGTLRLHLDSASDKAWEITLKYETLSRHVCEKCGRDGKICGDWWLITLCDDCNKGENNEV